MNDIEGVKKELMNSGRASELKQFVDSPEARNISRGIDGNALKKAVASGDKQAMSNILKQVLSTPDGQLLAKKIGETFGKKG